TLVARLVSAADPNTAIVDRLIRFYTAGGNFLGEDRTDSQGIATLTILKSARKQQYRAVFAGDAHWLESSATAGG
ncbi:MAG: hypothetical protein M3135_04090, partial [Actinomycetota bacterium]|nr:hypothetical protein [Actinomycetota bacterium]